jgi:hypothetical protein
MGRFNRGLVVVSADIDAQYGVDICHDVVGIDTS